MNAPSQSPTPAAARAALTRMVVLALFVVYVIWGSTYLALRFALESFPVFLMGGLRYGLSGAVLYVLSRRRGARAPTRADWWAAALVGTLLFAGGYGLVAIASRTISSGVVAILAASTPLWSVVFAALWGGRPQPAELVGLALGLLGVGLLQHGGAFSASAWGLGAGLLAPVSWALGSVWSARLPRPPGTMAAALQMMAGGLVMLLLAALLGERIGEVSVRAGVSFLYLIVFGSFVGFTAYQFLLVNTRPALATSYAFVNPTVALLLGAAVAGEPLTHLHGLACALTVLAVVCVLRGRSAPSGA